MFYELTVTIILDMLYIYINVVLVVKIVMFSLSPIINNFNVFSFVRRAELCSDNFLLPF